MNTVLVHHNDANGNHHPIVTHDGKASSACIICTLLNERDRFFLALESANDLLIQGKDVQAHRCLENALRNGVTSLLPSEGGSK